MLHRHVKLTFSERVNPPFLMLELKKSGTTIEKSALKNLHSSQIMKRITRTLPTWKNVALSVASGNLSLALLKQLASGIATNDRLATNFRRGSIRLELVEVTSAPLYIDRAKIVNSRWQPSTPLSRTSHAISAPLKISVRVWGARSSIPVWVVAKSRSRERRRRCERMASVCACMCERMCARSVRFTWFNSLPWLRYLTFHRSLAGV